MGQGNVSARIAAVNNLNSSGMGVLRVRLAYAMGLKAMDANGFSDPYVKLTVNGVTHKSKTIKKTLNPRWDEEFAWRGNFDQLTREALAIAVWDWDRMSINDHLGNGTLDLRRLTNLPSGQAIECQVKLADKQSQPGVVALVVWWEPDHTGANGAPHPYAHPNMPMAPSPAPYASPTMAKAGAATGAIVDTFHHFDANRSGFLDYNELRNALRHYGIDATQVRGGRVGLVPAGAPSAAPARPAPTLRPAPPIALTPPPARPQLESAAVLRRYDDHPDGRLELAEFAELVRDLESGVMRGRANDGSIPARVSAAFDHFDANRSGYLDYRELKNALAHYGIAANEYQASSLVRAYDDRPDGRLDKGEFATLVRDLEAGVMRREGTPAPASGSHYRSPGSRRSTDYPRNSSPGPYANGGSYGQRDYGRGSYRADSKYSYYSGGGYGSSARDAERASRLTVGAAYVLDVLVRTLLYAAATAAVVNPDRLAYVADSAARAVGADNANTLLTSPLFVLLVLGGAGFAVALWLDLLSPSRGWSSAYASGYTSARDEAGGALGKCWRALLANCFKDRWRGYRRWTGDEEGGYVGNFSGYGGRRSYSRY